MGVLQHLAGVAFLISYVLAIGGFLGREHGRAVVLATLLSAAAFIGSADNLVHGVILTAFAVLGVGAYLALAWILKVICESALEPVRRSDDVASPMTSSIPDTEAGSVIHTLTSTAC